MLMWNPEAKFKKHWNSKYRERLGMTASENGFHNSFGGISMEEFRSSISRRHTKFSQWVIKFNWSKNKVLCPMQSMRHSLYHRLTLMWHWQSLASTIFITFSSPLEPHYHSTLIPSRQGENKSPGAVLLTLRSNNEKFWKKISLVSLFFHFFSL